MFDECMTAKASRLIVEALRIHKPPIESQYLVDHFSSGLLDSDWTKRLQDEGGWCVVTCDFSAPRGLKARAKGPPLHVILPARKVTGFFLVGKIASRSGFEKARCVISLFPEILKRAQGSEPGMRFKVKISGSGYRIEPWPLTHPLPALD